MAVSSFSSCNVDGIFIASPNKGEIEALKAKLSVASHNKGII